MKRFYVDTPLKSGEPEYVVDSVKHTHVVGIPSENEDVLDAMNDLAEEIEILRERLRLADNVLVQVAGIPISSDWPDDRRVFPLDAWIKDPSNPTVTVRQDIAITVGDVRRAREVLGW